jgi:parvulin-like peptidyl-prolyl isomerase
MNLNTNFLATPTTPYNPPRPELPERPEPSGRSVLAVSEQDVAYHLKKQFAYAELTQKICHQRIIAEAAASRNITVADIEIQVEADRFRQENDLEKAADTIGWLDMQQITAEIWEESIHDRLLSQKLSQHLFTKDVDRAFAENRAIYDQVALYQIIVPYEQLAHELFYQIEEDEISFYEAAHLYDVDSTRRHRCGFEGVLARWQVTPALAGAVYGAPPMQVIEPIRSEMGFHLLWVEEFMKAELTDVIRQQLLDQLFQNWLTNEMLHLRHA